MKAWIKFEVFDSNSLGKHVYGYLYKEDNNLPYSIEYALMQEEADELNSVDEMTATIKGYDLPKQPYLAGHRTYRFKSKEDILKVLSDFIDANHPEVTEIYDGVKLHDGGELIWKKELCYV